MALLDRMKTSAGILSMVAAAGLVSIPVLMPAREDHMVQTDAGMALAPEVDWNTVDWSKGLRTKAKDGRILSPEEAEVIWKKLQREPQFQALPQVFKDLIKGNKEHYEWLSGNVDDFKLDKEGNCRFFVSDMISLDAFQKTGISIFMEKFKTVKLVDEPVETPAINPKTKRPYVMPSNNTIRSLKGDDLAYVRAFTEILNRNIHYVASTPIPKLDMAGVKRGEYIGTAFWPLSLIRPMDDLESTKTSTQRLNKRELRKTHAQLVDHFARGDEAVYRLQNVLGTPLYNPRAFAPNVGGRGGGGYDCNGYAHSELLGTKVVWLTSARQVEDPKWVLGFAYKRYFEGALDSIRLIKSGMAQELDTLDKKSPRYRAMSEVAKQATKLLNQLEKTAQKYHDTADKIYTNPPYTLLNAKRPATPRTVQRAGMRRPVARTSRQYE